MDIIILQSLSDFRRNRYVVGQLQYFSCKTGCSSTFFFVTIIRFNLPSAMHNSTQTVRYRSKKPIPRSLLFANILPSDFFQDCYYLILFKGFAERNDLPVHNEGRSAHYPVSRDLRKILYMVY